MLYNIFRKFSVLINELHQIVKTNKPKDQGLGVLVWQAEPMGGSTDDLRTTNFSAKGEFAGFEFPKSMRFFFMALLSMRYRYFGEDDETASKVYRKEIKKAFKSEFGVDL
jgi:hypothetical protein